ncbi:MAG: hypothetical protein AAB588_01655 [Patescibacteria group bacterium]
MSLESFTHDKKIDNFDVSISGDSGNFVIAIKEHNSGAAGSEAGAIERCEELLVGISYEDAVRLFSNVCRLLESAVPSSEVYRRVRACASTIKGIADRAEKIRLENEMLANDMHAALLEVTRFLGKETVNGIGIIVTWFKSHRQYEMFLPQLEHAADQTADIGDHAGNAELVFEYAEEVALEVETANALLRAVRVFIENGFSAPAPFPAPDTHGITI